MEFTLLERMKIFIEYKNLFKKNDTAEFDENSTLVVLPDSAIAVDLAQLFHDNSNHTLFFLIKDSLIDFYPKSILINSITYTFNDMNSLGMPRQIFVDKIIKSKFENIVDLNTSFSRFGAHLTLFCNTKVRMGFSYDNSKKYYNVILDSNYQRDLNGTFKMIEQFIKL
tara:strand:- start:413 stop:916 length:504 start_codon:yes stop_codon:yes gene_type:complete